MLGSDVWNLRRGCLAISHHEVRRSSGIARSDRSIIRSWSFGSGSPRGLARRWRKRSTRSSKRQSVALENSPGACLARSRWSGLSPDGLRKFDRCLLRQLRTCFPGSLSNAKKIATPYRSDSRPDIDRQRTASIRSNAVSDHLATSGSTTMGLTMESSRRFSRLQAK